MQQWQCQLRPYFVFRQMTCDSRELRWRELCAAGALNLHLTLRSGQAFAWERTEKDVWIGAVGETAVQLKEENGKILVLLDKNENDFIRVHEYFQLGHDMAGLYEDWKRRDGEFSKLASERKFQGLRILRQDPVECLFSFITSQNNNVKRISAILRAICKFAGKQISDSPQIHAFPDVCELARISEDDYRELGLGYRAKYFRATAAALAELGGRDFLLSLRGGELAQVRDCLMRFHGVGRKVADCVSLFSLDFAALVPCDTHVLALAKQRLKKSVKNPTPRDHDEIQDYFASVFGAYAGWAHSVLFVARLAEFKKPSAE